MRQEQPGVGRYDAVVSLADGQVFAGYRILRTLGSGGMGEVYLAQHPRLPRRDALKLLQADVSADDDYRTRFEREADMASMLWHPHIVGVHDRGETDGRLWISMDYVDGVNAAELLADRYPDGMPAATVASITTAIASALDYAHKQGLLHRDVKPANIMLTHVGDDGEQRILLADFGIARSVDDISGLTSTNMTVGTVAYAAPEQLMGDEIDGRVDQYALAATAYHLLTGMPLFSHTNPAVVISRHLNADPPAVSASKPALAEVDDVLRTALAKTPAERFGSASEFALRFREAVEGITRPSPLAATVEAPATAPARTRNATSPTTQVQRGSRSSPHMRVLVATGGVLAVIMVIALLWRPWVPRGADGEDRVTSDETTTAATFAPPAQQMTTTTTTPPLPTTTLPPEPIVPPPTEVVTAFAVTSSGQPSAGYTAEPARVGRSPLSECSQPSVSAVRPNIYSCYPFAASATTCWPSPPAAMLCLDDPWQKELTSFAFATYTLDPVQPTTTPEPIAVLLDDGSQCGILIGGARGRADGTTPLYGCERGTRPPIVVGPQDVGGGIERTSPAWTAWVAEEYGPMQARRVVTAIFAG